MPGDITLWSLVRFLHVAGAIVWVGGQLTLALVVTPVARRQLAPPEVVALMRPMGVRFAAVANAVVLPVLVATGIALAWHRGVTFDSFSFPGYGRTLGIKIGFVVASVALAALHGVLSVQGRRREARALSMAGLGASLVIVLLATSLVP